MESAIPLRGGSDAATTALPDLQEHGWLHRDGLANVQNDVPNRNPHMSSSRMMYLEETPTRQDGNTHVGVGLWCASRSTVHFNCRCGKTEDNCVESVRWEDVPKALLVSVDRFIPGNARYQTISRRLDMPRTLSLRQQRGSPEMELRLAAMLLHFGDSPNRGHRPGPRPRGNGCVSMTISPHPQGRLLIGEVQHNVRLAVYERMPHSDDPEGEAAT